MAVLCSQVCSQVSFAVRGFSKQQEEKGVELAVKSDGWTDSRHQYHPDRDQPIYPTIKLKLLQT